MDRIYKPIVNLEEILNEDGLHKSLVNKRRQSDLFDFGVCDSKAYQVQDLSSEYDTSLQKEIYQWTKLLKNKQETFKRLKSPSYKCAEKEILNEEMFQQINQLPNFKKFLEESEEFYIKCNNFFEIYDGALNAQKKLIKNCHESVRNDILRNCVLDL